MAEEELQAWEILCRSGWAGLPDAIALMTVLGCNNETVLELVEAGLSGANEAKAENAEKDA